MEMNEFIPYKSKPQLTKKRVWILRITLLTSIVLFLYSILAVLWSVFVAIIAGTFFLTAVTRGQQIYDYAYELIPYMNCIKASAIAGCGCLVLFFILKRKFKK
ncbi:MAG TPA: hypothetical protein DD729_05740 [Rhodobacteraceae bacterium]|jgi:peptidoglycan biosynthesis protein MviN/MurJ (putative lipid II flippase)|nr:hypothetical protein [Paracoccaceae bacterium]